MLIIIAIIMYTSINKCDHLLRVDKIIISLSPSVYRRGSFLIMHMRAVRRQVFCVATFSTVAPRECLEPLGEEHEPSTRMRVQGGSSGLL